MTPAEIIAKVRPLIQDDSTLLPNRYTDAVLLGFVNQAILRMVQPRPDLFITQANISTTPDQVEQTLPTGAVRLVEIFRITGGAALRETNREMLDMNVPNWTVEASSTPVNWMRHPRTPTKYFLYPSPVSGVQVKAEYVATPPTYALGDTIALPDSYFTVLVDGTVWLAESVDNESIGTGRAKMFYESFMEALGVEFSQRSTVDSEHANVGAAQQRRSSKDA